MACHSNLLLLVIGHRPPPLTRTFFLLLLSAELVPPSVARVDSPSNRQCSTKKKKKTYPQPRCNAAPERRQHLSSPSNHLCSPCPAAPTTRAYKAFHAPPPPRQATGRCIAGAFHAPPPQNCRPTTVRRKTAPRLTSSDLPPTMLHALPLMPNCCWRILSPVVAKLLRYRHPSPDFSVHYLLRSLSTSDLPGPAALVAHSIFLCCCSRKQHQTNAAGWV